MDTSNTLRFASRQRECDLVMRGGITSGIVYPKAVAELARTFTFRSIGGTSAGAIAAVITAAAQYGVSSGANPRAFEAISHLPETLAQPVEGHAFINRLFAPDAATAPLYRLIAAVAYAKSGWDKLRAALTSDIVKPRLAKGAAGGSALRRPPGAVGWRDAGRGAGRRPARRGHRRGGRARPRRPPSLPPAGARAGRQPLRPVLWHGEGRPHRPGPRRPSHRDALAHRLDARADPVEPPAAT